MGCDFFYSGILPDIKLQEKVVKWIAEYYEEKAVLIQPCPEDEYLTEYILSQSLRYPDRLNMYEEIMYRHEHGTKRMQYPFNYYGVVPLHGWELHEHSQIIFDRSAEGRMVRFLKLPDKFGLPARDDFYREHDAEVVLREGGYDRLIHNRLHFALLLCIINLRWFSTLNVGDDYSVYDTVSKVIEEVRLMETFRDETMNYQQCWDIFEKEYDKRSDLY